MLHICSYCVYMEKTKHPIVRIDSDVMDDLEGVTNNSNKKISKAGFVSEAITEKIERIEEEKTKKIVMDFFKHYQEKSSAYYEKGIKSVDEFISMLALNKNVLEIGKAQKKLEKEVKEYHDVSVYALDVFDKLKDDLKEKVKNLQIT